MKDPFIDLCLGVQAIRRKVEREVAGLGGATGVAAVPYPHQLANVQRILSDSRIRHLLADEVGMGKTVQTLMIINALRLQNPRHRTLILVPENIAPQWLLECQTRGHFTPLGRAPEDEEDTTFVRLAYFDQLGSVTEIDPSLYDLLVVDELHRLQATARQRIVDVARDFRQLLLLSATPKLEDLSTFRQLMNILEPERMAFAARLSETPEEVLRDRETKAADLLGANSSNAWRQFDFLVPPESRKPESVAITHCLLRRVLHTNRSDYPDLLPQRVLHKVVIEPTSDEVERQTQVWRFIGDSENASSTTDLARLGQVALRSPRALSERVNILRGRDQRDPQGFLAAATRYLEAANGDSRIEATIDLLAEIWDANPNEAVLIVAEDNPTVDYLERMIPQYLPTIGPRHDRRSLSLAVSRNRDASATSDLVGLFGEYDDGLGGFVDGEDQLLIAADIAQVGLNLQHARKLIFFSVPWSPISVEQWIGRLDRLGSAALLDQPGERTIDIYPIYQRGQVDERVVSVLDDFGIFRRSIRLDGDDIDTISGHITKAALKPHTINWQKLSNEARHKANDDHREMVTPLSSVLPWTPDGAREVADYYDQRGSLGPLLQHSNAKRAIVRSEVGLRSWMRLMGRANELRLWKRQDPQAKSKPYRLLHYYRSQYTTGPIEPRFLLPSLDPREGQRYAYIDGRRELESPPLPTVSLDENPATPLNFLDHGNSLHEALLDEWAKIVRQGPSHLRVNLPDGHALANNENRGTYLVVVLSCVPGDQYFSDLERDRLIKSLQSARTRSEQKPYWDAIQKMEEDLRADRRWLNSLFTARLEVIAAKLSGTEWALVEQEVAHSLFTPWDVDARGADLILAQGYPAKIDPGVKSALSAGGELLLQEATERHRNSLRELPDLKQHIDKRRFLVASEADDLIRLRQAAFDDASARGMEKSEQGFTRSRFRAISNALDIAKHSRNVRLERLDRLNAEIIKPSYSEQKYLVIMLE
ncbi:DEAD/DEAH box helicase family protein (plasmid) [Leisingera sp. S132]|uniref:SNF2-related protein n=1 Tax=Leisingera sp. S132 TaxID=2867016 RepID=UPI0021A461C3|nr:SNF2-related protein [Leisingera sp. S132]UWQ81462.1 DEAD/DEAH box helicase family protein [Leisingera sp. S132]